MQAIIVLFVMTLGLFLILKFVTPKYGEDVESRFIERIKYIPSQKPALLNKGNLARWLANAENRDAISGYVIPVLFPLDVLFLLSLGLLLGFASAALASTMGFLSSIPHWVWWLFPVLYIASDLSEDVVVAAIFKSFVPLSNGSFSLLSTLTAIKLAAITIAIGQVGFLAALLALVRFFPAPR